MFNFVLYKASMQYWCWLFFNGRNKRQFVKYVEPCFFISTEGFIEEWALSLSFLGSHLPGTFAVFSTSHSRELRLPWTELLLMEQKHLQIIILMSLAGLIIKHNVGSVLKLLCLVSWGLYSNASSKDIGRGGCEG